jgi:hypothetical protein
MTLTPEQTRAVAGWAAAGDNLSTIQRKLTAEFKVSITYMDLRFVLDDLNLELKDAAPKKDTMLAAGAAPVPPGEGPARGGAKGFIEKAKEKLGLGKEEAPEDEDAADGLPEEELPPAGAGRVTVGVDKVTLLPGALASGTVAFGDGVTGKWIVDNQGRPGITEISKANYRPSPADAQAFMMELSRTLQQHGF